MKREIPESKIRQGKIIAGAISVSAAITVLALAVLIGYDIVLVVVTGVILALCIWLGLWLGDWLTRRLRGF